MLTPRFTLTQDEGFIIAHIETPYVKFSEGEMYMVGNEFSFFCKPYHLKLYFSSEVVEDGTESAVYDVDSGKFEIKIPKAEKGEIFRDLNMLTKLMTPNSNEHTLKASALIEVLDGCKDPEDLPEYDEDDIDWSIDHSLPTSDSLSLSTSNHKYGFNLQSSGVFLTRTEDKYELLDIEDPDSTTVSERSTLQKQRELCDFSADHYLCDLMEDDTIQEFITYKTEINKLYRKVAKGAGNVDDSVQLTQEETESILRLPKKRYLLDQSEKRCALIGLVDILYACLYDIRTTIEDASVESAWNIRKLSSTLSWLTSESDIKSALISCVTRVLCYPLHRHWVLAMKVIEDVRHVLTLGRKQVLKCLLYVQKQFNNTESYHIHNSLYITDYCVWIQTVPESALQSLSNKIKHCQLNKQDLHLGICELEQKFLDDSESEEESSSSDVTSSDVDSDDSEDETVESRVDGQSPRSLLDTVNQKLSSLDINTECSKTIQNPLIQVIDEDCNDDSEAKT